MRKLFAVLLATAICVGIFALTIAFADSESLADGVFGRGRGHGRHNRIDTEISGEARSEKPNRPDCSFDESCAGECPVKPEPPVADESFDSDASEETPVEENKRPGKPNKPWVDKEESLPEDESSPVEDESAPTEEESVPVKPEEDKTDDTVVEEKPTRPGKGKGHGHGRKHRGPRHGINLQEIVPTIEIK